MTSTLTHLGAFMNRYRDEGEWMEPCTPVVDFGFMAAAALFGGFGFAVLILCLEKCL